MSYNANTESLTVGSLPVAPSQFHIGTLPHWVLTDSNPAFYDSESATAIEQTAKVYGRVNELVDLFNQFTTAIETRLDDYTESTDTDLEEFKVGLRQEFQDFIDIIDLKIQEEESRIGAAELYMRNNIRSTTQEVVNENISAGNIAVEIEYDQSNENMNFNITNGGGE